MRRYPIATLCLVAVLPVRAGLAGVDIAAESRAIDALVREYHAENEIQPIGLTTDNEFIRRAYLDITGTIPTYEATTGFLQSTDPDKRATLIHELLQSPGHVSHFFNYWAALLRVPIRVRGMPAGAYALWIKNAIADNMPYDDFVRGLVAAKGDSAENGATGYYLRDQQMRLDTVNATAQIFLGTQLGCAQCHDHKFDKWTQKDYYQFAAYMGQVNVRRDRQEARRVRREMEDVSTAKRRQLQQYLQNMSVDVVDRRYKQLRYPEDYAYDNAEPGAVVQPRVIFGNQPVPEEGESQRDAFAQWLTSPENPMFTKVIANRLWKKATGVGLVEPVDDFNDYTEAVHPELLDHLTGLVVKLDYDMNLFLEILYNTRTYQLASEGTEVTAGNYEFQAAPLRRMSAEQIWDSFITLGIKDANSVESTMLEELSETMAAMQESAGQMDMQAERRRRGGQNHAARRASDIPTGNRFSDVLNQFGRSTRETIDEGSTDPSIPQALFLMNSEQIQRLVTRRQSPLLGAASEYADPGDRIRVLYLSTLTREPTKKELETALKYARDNDHNETEAYQDLAWALINTREFLFIR